MGRTNRTAGKKSRRRWAGWAVATLAIALAAGALRAQDPANGGGRRLVNGRITAGGGVSDNAAGGSLIGQVIAPGIAPATAANGSMLLGAVFVGGPDASAAAGWMNYGNRRKDGSR